MSSIHANNWAEKSGTEVLRLLRKAAAENKLNLQSVLEISERKNFVKQEKPFW